MGIWFPNSILKRYRPLLTRYLIKWLLISEFGSRWRGLTRRSVLSYLCSPIKNVSWFDSANEVAVCCICSALQCTAAMTHYSAMWRVRQSSKFDKNHTLEKTPRPHALSSSNKRITWQIVRSE